MPPSGVGNGCLCSGWPLKEPEQHNDPNPKGLAEDIVNDASGDGKGQKIVPRKSKPSLQGR